MAGPFTQPDPLFLSDKVKTFSIYVTELQVCVNEKRQEIGQVSLTFINQKVGKTMFFSAIEELKTRTNQLALDFGFTGGVTNSELLGRPYVDHPKVGGKPAAGFPIINDLRQVLEKLVQKVFPDFIGTNWWPLAADSAMAGWDEQDDPWANNPIAAQLGPNSILGTCSIGDEFLVDCDSTLAGNFRGSIAWVTDAYISFSSTVIGEGLRVGPFGGPYFENPGFNGALVEKLDNEFTYTGTSVGTGITSATDVFKRDHRIPIIDNHQNLVKILLGTVLGGQQFGTGLTRLSVVASNKTHILLFLDSAQSTNLFFAAFYALVPKTGGSPTPIAIPFQNLLSTVPVGSRRYKISSGWKVDSNGDFVTTYIESDRVFTSPSAGFVTCGSGIIKLTIAGSISVSDISTDSRSFTGGLPEVNTFRCHHAHSNVGFTSPLFPAITKAILSAGIGNGGIYYNRTAGSLVEVTGSLPTITNQATFNGTNLSNTDYKGDTMTNTNRGAFDSQSHWLARVDTVPILNPVNFDSAVRNFTTNRVDVEFEHQPGVFRYRLQRRLSTVSTFTTARVVELVDFFTLGIADSPVVSDIPGLVDDNADYFIRIQIETATGLINGAEVLVAGL